MNTGRNAPCPCGSGKKYKKCCRDRTEARAAFQSLRNHAQATARGMPSLREIGALVVLFRQKRYREAELAARAMIDNLPPDGLGSKIFGAVLKKIVRNRDVLAPLQEAAALSPNSAEAHCNLGNALKELGRLKEAEASYRRVLKIQPDYADAHNNLGNALRELGRLKEAEASYRRALEINPDYADAHCNLGSSLYGLGQLNDADASYRRALKINPGFAGAYSNLGIVLRDLGRLDEAEANCRRALQIKPDFVDALNVLGATLMVMGRLDEAEASYRRALQVKPDYADAYSNLGNVLMVMGRLDEAEVSCRRALQIKPDHADAHNSLCAVLHELGRLEEAEASCRRALQIKPDHADAHNSLCAVLHELGRLEEAEASCRRALQIKPDHADAHYNLGVILQTLSRFEEAEASYRRVPQIKPEFAGAQMNLGMLFLTIGQFQRGWQGYEMRWKRKNAERLPETPYPCWLGKEDIAGKKLLIQFEQGLGDGIQMLRYISLLEQNQVKCWIQAPNSLLRLIARSFPCAKLIEQHVCPKGLDYRVPMMSLPLAMRTFSEQAIPKPVPYLEPNDDRVGFWKEQLASARSKTVGLVWRGNPNHKNDRLRSASLKDLLPLIAAHESILFVTLQKDLTDAERSALKDCSNVHILDDELADFDETAAVMCNMDIVISVDTAPAHLSGALGKPTWILLSFSGEWRWMVDRTDSPWYPTARLFRQKSTGSWAEVISNVNTALAEPYS